MSHRQVWYCLQVGRAFWWAAQPLRDHQKRNCAAVAVFESSASSDDVCGHPKGVFAIVFQNANNLSSLGHVATTILFREMGTGAEKVTSRAAYLKALGHDIQSRWKLSF